MPGSADAALTVGAVTKQDQLSSFSSRGPRVGDYAIKPDLTAPGQDIVAGRAAGTALGTPAGEHYTSASGTSMASPHVAGAAALLSQAHPGWRAEQLKSALTSTTPPHPQARVWDQGTGRLDLGRAVTQPVYATPGSVGFGYLRWPHDRREPVTRTVAYHNEGGDPVTLELDLQARGPDGRDAPAGLFTTGARQVTVPAHGSAELPVTAHAGAEVPDGLYSARLTAVSSDGGTRLQTVLAVYREPESYDVTVDAIDRAGKPAGRNLLNALSYVGLDNPDQGYERFSDGRRTLRLRLHVPLRRPDPDGCPGQHRRGLHRVRRARRGRHPGRQADLRRPAGEAGHDHRGPSRDRGADRSGDRRLAVRAIREGGRGRVDLPRRRPARRTRRRPSRAGTG
jgi:Subtilase family